MTNATDAPTPPESIAAEPVVTVVCSNCGTPLQGEYCYSCGQPVKGMIRPLSSMLHDVADTVLNIDSRIFRTLWPLLIKPGFLSNEYFAGRRVRFVTPFRLYFFMSIAAFFAMQLALGDMNFHDLNIRDDSTSFSNALTREEVLARRDAAIAGLDVAKSAPGISTKQSKKIDAREDKIRTSADKRIAYLQRVADAKANGTAPPPAADGEVDVDPDAQHVQIMGKEWDPEKNPVHVSWLPDFANARLNAAVGRAKANMSRITSDPKPFVLSIFSVLPQVLFVVMPLFALILKIFFIFKRRLYMEHLIIALHSHAFIFFSLLLITVLIGLKNWLAASAEWLTTPTDWLITILGWWIPIYLFVMQKRVYRQGWIMTTIKYCVIGVCYIVVISFGVAAAAIVSIATT